MVQNALGYVASLGEGVKNTFNFSVPFLSWLAIVILAGVALILYFISLREALEWARRLQNATYYQVIAWPFSERC